ncbi:uroporphyrinogen-III synthase [Sphingobium sp. EP60837]|uniref:uroporphyrinogen-III synthase n=1 Tax=Sphingobium sp. EP60837 TaxID=1855519 RepID=UPI0007DD7CED|nr:uroporphyrinogen-III synthase [Sphingobium sp. EP60837]ANI77771.1 Uroporphyrinogen-III synthase [Sphingobium sp. EP60837]
MRPVVILRPEPGASESAARAKRLGLPPRLCPLFEARPIDWDAPPPGAFDALLMTSAQAARLGGPPLDRYRKLPAYAVGSATACAMADAGFLAVVPGDQDGSAIAARIAADGHRRLLHLGGTTVASIEAGPLSIRHVAVYTIGEKTEVDLEPLLEPGAVLLVHSPRAGSRLASLIDTQRRSNLHVIAISAAALAACGSGWASGEAPDQPDDERMLALAVRLCE